MREIEPGLCQLGHGDAIAGQILEWRVDCATEHGPSLGQGRRIAVARPARSGDFIGCVVECLLRDDALGPQLLHPLQLRLVVAQGRLGRAQVGTGRAIGIARGIQVVAGGGNLRLHLIDGNLQWFRIDAEKQFALVHGLILAHGDLDHAAADLRCDGDLIGLHIGIVSRGVAPRRNVEIAGDKGDDERTGDPEDAVAAPGPGLDGVGGDDGFGGLLAGHDTLGIRNRRIR